MYMLCVDVHLYLLVHVFMSMAHKWWKWLVMTHTIVPIPPDLTLTPSNMSAVLHTVQDLWKLGCRVLRLPFPVYASVRVSSSFTHDDQRKEALFNHYLFYHPLASWAHLAGWLCRLEEHTVLQEVRKYISQRTGDYKLITVKTLILACH